MCGTFDIVVYHSFHFGMEFILEMLSTCRICESILTVLSLHLLNEPVMMANAWTGLRGTD